MKKIFISSDHAGFKLKELIKSHLNIKKIIYKDLGPYNDSRVDYPDSANKVSKKVNSNKHHIGILICGSGTGMNIAANKHPNVRASQCFNVKSTKSNFFLIRNFFTVSFKKKPAWSEDKKIFFKLVKFII